MTQPPRLADPSALARNRARAARAPALVLQEAVADEVQERLHEVNRSFTAPAVVTPWPDLWAGRLAGARCVQDTEVLDLQPGAHDLVLHMLALHWAADPVGQLVQARHALRPDGLMIATLFGGQTLAELRACLAEAEARVTGGLSPRVAPMAEVRDAGALLQRAGFALPVADSTRYRLSYPDALALMHDLRAMGEGNALDGRLRHPTRRAVLLAAAELYADRFAEADGRIIATFDVITLTGWAPAPDQPQPLRPGSAAQRLADALGAVEHPLPRNGE
ncbi:MAG: SAM-dependent methyltransferase [Limimaricola sp.]|uniref:SAM-dependent methyltransferase n=1 Tax=Limimaricola sp. TaxID=2211665 RepID=UPI001DD3D4EE|nr:SAM-dependent methyltransferase [Limimaricola sp.]MBI1417192.1 SAM-dependent methyltransferase [Limimaricola sp.]